MNLGDTIRSGTKWLIASATGGQVLQFVFGVALARLLVPADFGMLVTIQVFTGIAGLFASGGMGQALVQTKTIEENDYQVVFTLQLAIGVLLYAFFFGIAPAFARWFDQPLYADLLRVSAVSFLLRPFANVPHARLNREMRLKQKAVIAFGSILITGLASVALAATGHGVWSLILGGIVGSICNIAMLLVATRWRPRVRTSGAATRKFANYGFWVSAADIACYLRSQASNLIISRMAGPSTVGVFNKADSLASMPFNLVSASAYSAVFTTLARFQEDRSKSQYIYTRTVCLLAVYTLPLYVGLAWTARPFVDVVYGAKWVGAAEPMVVLAAFCGLYCVIHPAGAVIAAQNWLHREVLVQINWALLASIGCLVGLDYGLTGVAWGLAIAQAYAALHMAWLVHSCIGARYRDLLAALTPGALLSGWLIVVLLGIDVCVARTIGTLHPAVYLLLASSVGGIAYIGAFLYAPIPALSEEALRWKRTLHLTFKT